MDNEKKYKEALERAKQFSEKPYLEDSKGIVEYIFPELQESEDERIRKSLIDMLKNDEKCYLKEIAWLKKQGEHAKFRDSIQVGDKVTRNQDGVLVNLSQLNRVAKKDEKQGDDKVEPKFKVGDVIRLKGSAAEYTIKKITDTTYYTNGWSCGIERCEEDYELVEQKPAEWSEEDENHAKSILSTIECCKAQFPNAQAVVEAYNADIEWFKNLKERCNWKPSEEQLHTLEKATHIVGSKYKSCLKSLYQDLQKLMEE